MEIIDKKTDFAFRKNIYLLGEDEEGIKYWLEEPTWDCGWYWSWGYVETYTNNRCPSKSRDISSHQHFDSLFFKDSYEAYKKLFKKSVLDEKEIWSLLELMKTGYILKESAGLFEKGSAWISHNNCYDVIKDQKLYEEIVKVKMPAIISEVCNLLGGSTTPEQFRKKVIIED